ncbi:30S ribosomal protein S4e [Sulfodiicoccus acidiphilus]|nr:30S ribosomal protein S4e [Sulfodiicoccus acidiphilus]
MGNSTYRTRHAAPKFVPVGKKESKWYVRTSPGPHSASRSIPLGSVLRDSLKVASTMTEARKLIAAGAVLVDGRAIKDYKFPIGLMDIISFPSAGQHYRVVPDPIKYLKLIPISGEEARFKYVRVIGKVMTNKSMIQINLEDGRNIRTSMEKYRTELQVDTFTTLKLNLEDGSVITKFELKEGSYAVAVAGRNVGLHGRISEIRTSPFKSKRDSLVTVESSNKDSFQTRVINIMAIGGKSPDVRLD